MNTRNLIGLTALALAMGSALADEGLSRAQVREDVIAARKAGTLVPAGEGVTPGYPKAADRASSVSRAQVKSDVLAARATGRLVPAGPGSPEDRVYAQQVAAASTTTRGEMKQEVLAARANGELIPAGEGAMPTGERATHVAGGNPTSIFAALHRKR
jgi:hypothetical protein